MNIALVHEHLAQDGGAEKVLLAMQEIFASAPTYTLIHNPKKANPAFLNKDIRTSFLQNLPFAKTKYQWYLPLMPQAVERYNLMAYDVVLSSASAFAKGVITRSDAIHICYCHSPTRYLWSDTHEYVASLHQSELVKKAVLAMMKSLRVWDRLAADRVDYFLANSKTVQERIRKYYRRDSTIIYPPVDVDKFKVGDTLSRHFVTGGRLVPYKRFDLTVEAFNHLGIPLKIFGSGPEEQRLRAMAKPNIQFLGKVDFATLHRVMNEAQAFIHPHEEDFGITAVESLAAGRPVIAFAKGGALETVTPGLTGTFFDEQEWEVLADAVLRFKASDYNPQAIRKDAERFSRQAFAKNIKEFVETHSTMHGITR